MEYLNRLRVLGITAERSGKYHCPNPTCSDKRHIKKDLSVTFQPNRVVYQCHNEGCNFKGVVFHNQTYNKASKKTYQRPEKPKVNESQEAVYKYFQDRGISKEIVDKFGVYMSGNRMVFPYYKDGELVNNKYRWKTKENPRKFMQEKEAEQIFYGMDFITGDTLIIVEGEVDCLSLAEVGIEAVSVPTGGTDTKLDCIENCYEWLQKFETYIIAVDMDDTGDKLKNNLLSRLDKTKCKIAKYELEGNEGLIKYKDANEVLTKCDFAKDFLNIVIDTAEYLPVENIMVFNDVEEQLIDFFNNGIARGKSTGWKNLDKIISIRTGYLGVITGRPSSGKSHIYKNLLYNLTEQYDYKHVMFDKESNINISFANLAMMYKKNYFYGHNKMSEQDVRESIKYLSEYFKIYPRVTEWTIDDILDKAKECVKRYGVKTLTIDPFNKVKMDIGEKGIRLYVRDFLNKCGDFAVSDDVLVTVIAHPTKPVFGKKQPELYDISESADWANMADYGLVMYREKKDNVWSDTTNIMVEKVKDDSLGDTSGGLARLTKEKGRFVEKEPGTTTKAFYDKRGV